MRKIVSLVTWPIRKAFNLTKGVNDAIQAPTVIGNAAKDGMTYVTKLAGATTGAAGVAKGSVDAIEALVCQDGVCFVVSCIGVGADSLQIMASFVPGPNVTTLITTPISVGCKVFVWCCKKSKLPWGGC